MSVRKQKKMRRMKKKLKHCRKPMKHLGFNFYRCVVCGEDFMVRRTTPKMQQEVLKDYPEIKKKKILLNQQ